MLEENLCEGGMGQSVLIFVHGITERHFEFGGSWVVRPPWNQHTKDNVDAADDMGW